MYPAFIKKIFIVSLVTLILLGPTLVLGAPTGCKTGADGVAEYCPLEPTAFESFGSTGGDIRLFLSKAFEFGLAIAAALSVVMIVWGGVEIMLSESLFKKEDGKKKIQDAIWGLLLALVSYLILYTINPQILEWDFSAEPAPSTSSSGGESLQISPALNSLINSPPINTTPAAITDTINAAQANDFIVAPGQTAPPAPVTPAGQSSLEEQINMMNNPIRPTR